MKVVTVDISGQHFPVSSTVIKWIDLLGTLMVLHEKCFNKEFISRPTLSSSILGVFPKQMDVDAIIVMGVSGCGKTTVGTQIAKHLGWTYKDGDEFHSDANITKMSSGIPLNDEDRRPWLTAINDYCKSHPKVVVGCSALKRKYRDMLRNDKRTGAPSAVEKRSLHAQPSFG
ncbi:unnamed protein product [Strongylus vulgaris]|uniref:Gluconokinase n=1 Tax=Strongylus vulgaris TaxID=40348 RepID=A0A3P7J297_STRVU|nr:unnamed protein product [Strongylus vulgaris]